MSPAISIVTISYNQGVFLAECLASVRAQKDAGVEHILVDAGSTDESVALIRAAAVDVFLHGPDAGPADGLNRGFARASGEIFGYVNADDRLAPGALAFVRDWFASHPGIDVLCGAIRIIDRHGRASLRARTADPFDLARYAAGTCTVGQQGTFFRRRAFAAAGGFNAANRVTWDGELLVDMALAGARFATVERVLGEFRVYDGTISGSHDSRARQAAEHARVRAKIRAAGVPVRDGVRRAVQRLAYKLDARRHLRYLRVR